MEFIMLLALFIMLIVLPIIIAIGFTVIGNLGYSLTGSNIFIVFFYGCGIGVIIFGIFMFAKSIDIMLYMEKIEKLEKNAKHVKIKQIIIKNNKVIKNKLILNKK